MGTDVAAQLRVIRKGQRTTFRAAGEILGHDSVHAEQAAGWIPDRSLLLSRKWSPATMAALNVAAQAIADAAWSAADRKHAGLVVGTSRGGAAGWLSPWPQRRPFRQMAASNSIHSEPASAISIEFGITGPNHVIASGCAAGLDAAGIAMMMLRAGIIKRALVVAVDLPLVPQLMDGYRSSGILSQMKRLDPYAKSTDGLIPAEAAAALTLELESDGHPSLLHYSSNADATDPLGMPADGGRTPELFEKCSFDPVAICPHATGTPTQAIADPRLFERSFLNKKPSLHLLKPYVGHAIGASGLIESVILAAFMRHGLLPPNDPELSHPGNFVLPTSPMPVTGPVVKISHGMGGHNSILAITPP
ncbi:MAG: beta-ketoacyl synthase N-terminal-like domain-containing protein [Luteolibacter sp.]